MKLVRSLRASELVDDIVGYQELQREDIAFIEALADFHDVLDLALAVAEKRLDPVTALRTTMPTRVLRAAFLGRHP